MRSKGHEFQTDPVPMFQGLTSWYCKQCKREKGLSFAPLCGACQFTNLMEGLDIYSDAF